MNTLSIVWFIIGVLLMLVDANKGDYQGAVTMLAIATFGAILLEYIIYTLSNHHDEHEK